MLPYLFLFILACICAATDMTSGNGMTLGEVHTITGSETLTSPSLAMKSDGSQAMIVWKQETEKSLAGR